MCIQKIKRCISTLSLSIITGTLWCQSATNFFPDKDLMTFGSYYYPEQWNPSQWERDLKNMSEIGIDFTHFAEFAWAELEPEEGINEKDMEMKIRAVDRKRRDYYQYYTGNTWGRAQNYHLCVDSSLVGVDGCLRAALAYLEDVCKDEEKPEDGEKETV